MGLQRSARKDDTRLDLGAERAGDQRWNTSAAPYPVHIALSRDDAASHRQRCGWLLSALRQRSHREAREGHLLRRLLSLGHLPCAVPPDDTVSARALSGDDAVARNQRRAGRLFPHLSRVEQLHLRDDRRPHRRRDHRRLHEGPAQLRCRRRMEANSSECL